MKILSDEWILFWRGTANERFNGSDGPSPKHMFWMAMGCVGFVIFITVATIDSQNEKEENRQRRVERAEERQAFADECEERGGIFIDVHGDYRNGDCRFP